MTTSIVTIGWTGTTTTRDYGNWAAFVTAWNAKDLTVSGALPNSITGPTNLIVQCYNDGAEIPLGASVTQALTLTTNASNTFTITAATGQSFVDSGSHLCYDASLGAAIVGSAGINPIMTFSVSYITISKMMFRQTSTTAASMLNVTGPGITSSLCSISQSIFSNASGSTAYGAMQLKSSVIQVQNCAFIQESSTSVDPWFYLDTIQAGTSITSCTFAAPVATQTAARVQIVNGSAGVILRNCAIFGMYTGYNPDSTAGTATYNTDGHNADDTAFNTTTVGSITGQTATSCFIAYSFTTPTGSSSTLNLQMKSGGPLQGAGTATGTPSTDIWGQTRPSPPGIGASDIPGGVSFGAARWFISN